MQGKIRDLIEVLDGEENRWRRLSFRKHLAN
jgi:hypothetical protein